jgi:hypothetical protein
MMSAALLVPPFAGPHLRRQSRSDRPQNELTLAASPGCCIANRSRR